MNESSNGQVPANSSPERAAQLAYNTGFAHFSGAMSAMSSPIAQDLNKAQIELQIAQVSAVLSIAASLIAANQKKPVVNLR